MIMFDDKMVDDVHTENSLYNGIRYNSKIRYNVNPICTKSAECVFFIDSPVLFYGKTYASDIY